MKNRPCSQFRLLGFCLALVVFVGAPRVLQAVDFQTEVRSILRSKCFKCHSGPKAKKGLRFDDERTLKEFIDGEDKVIVTGKPEDSLMLKKAMLPRDDTDAMPPPRRGDPLTRDEIRTIATWIKEGASFESADATSGTPTTTDGDKPAASSEVHTWINTEGNQVKAGFVRLEESSVVLLLESGKEYPYPLDKLSAESQALAKKLAGGGE